MKNLRGQEVFALVYRLFLVFFFYQIARFLFWFFNQELVKVDWISEYLKLSYYGTAFDTTAILYVNSVFILLSIIPIVINTKKNYQKFLFFWYFITNGITYAFNFGDMIYYRFSQARLTSAAFSVAKNESNIGKVFFNAVLQNPFVILSFILMMFLWIFLYKKVKVEEERPRNLIKYFASSIVILCVTALLVVGGIRGDFKHSTRPINLVDANKHVRNPLQGNLVLNSVFSFFRTINTNNFKLVHFVDEKFIEKEIKPYKFYEREVDEKPNIVIFILESFGKEYSGAFNKNTNIKDFVSYTPFLDSLANEGLIFSNAFANGRQSIHGMSSVLAGIPSLTDAFTSSPYSNQKIQSIVSVCNDLGYDTSFYHGAPNGSMGFQGFGNILGFKHYFGKNEYNNDNDFDGMWSIWDEPFFQYFAKNIGKNQPFMSTLFSASSHDPFKVPEKYQNKFKSGPLQIHVPIQYTDDALKKFFETASKQPWYQNTIFVITADHTNQIQYQEYFKPMNRFAIPLLFFSPNPKYNLKGVDEGFAQQMDIYPTLADLIGYNKKIRSWGRSLVSNKNEDSIIVNSNAINEQMIIGNYIYIFNGKEVTGIYDKTDLGLSKNLFSTNLNSEQKLGIEKTKAWYQDYMDRVINRKLY
ncbi:sulfatase-like hydrolase/transferase [Epilithonimonas ginsengisoli]|uniref:Sulfatase-like hydrolase/transferase n=1 Tax=Epilithonimonas ginsengisoli TaxID=1245592 RepID=A0ABU4JMU1_9FLAO|nr:MULTISPECIES: alkaline phosphatase family protein [Chryseobacterium group]MBV6881933.1 sulfatase-like hydrolase/transferase [Epilithonimonas sp. FP105]MDW8551010.1 sulfatase-like hydrolase/transferase [Epilithonimonas ginsengisoli]OAH65933.1 sulfatase [Chryseobacterium sp. FP211-J200]